MQLRTVGFILFSLLLHLGSSAQHKWTLRECIEYAKEHNINIRNNFLNVLSAELYEQEAKFSYVPSLAANVGYNISTGRSLDPTTYEFVENTTVQSINTGIGLNTTLFAGLQKYNQLKKSQLERLAAVEDFERAKNDMSLNITFYYLEILYNKELIVSIERQIESSEIQIDKMRKMMEAGNATRGDVLDLEAQKATEEYSLVDARNALELALLNLCQILEIKRTEGFDVLVPYIEELTDIFPAETVDQIYYMAETLPQIEGARLRVGAAERNIRIFKGAMYPTLNFNGSYSSAYTDSRKKPVLLTDANGNPILSSTGSAQVTYNNYPFLDQLRDNAGTSFNFSLNIPLFNSLNARRNVKFARLNYQRYVNDLELEKQQLYKNIQQAYTDALGSMGKYVASRKKLEASEESIRYMEQKFNAGAATIVDYTVAKNNILIAETQMTQAKYDYLFRVKVLEFYKGYPIDL